MKTSISALIAIFLVTGCSPEGDKAAGQPSAPVAADLEQAKSTFGESTARQKRRSMWRTMLFPFLAMAARFHSVVRLRVQQYESDKLKATVIYPDATSGAIWIKYTLPNPWTSEQISAALKVYGTDWKIVEQNLGVTFIMREQAPVVHLSSTGILAHKTMVNELVIYAPQLHADLRNEIAEADRQKKAVPKF